MKRIHIILTLLLSLCFTPAAQAQLEALEDLDGTWYGSISQYPRGLDTIYDFSVTVITQGDSLRGTTFIRMRGDQSQYWGYMDFEGELADGKLRIRESNLLDENLFSIAYWCFKTLYLERESKSGKVILKGHWRSFDCNGSSGEVYLERSVS